MVVGCYVLGGCYSYIVSVIMIVIIVKVVGCKNIVVCFFLCFDVGINLVIIYVVYVCGVDKIFVMGGV